MIIYKKNYLLNSQRHNMIKRKEDLSILKYITQRIYRHYINWIKENMKFLKFNNINNLFRRIFYFK
jgi:hypothetical protein